MGLSPTILHRKILMLLSLYLQSVFTGSAAAAQGEAEAHRGHYEREDDRRGEASQVHRREEAARTLLRKRTHRAYSFRERTV
jgi:hypothetical protein